MSIDKDKDKIGLITGKGKLPLLWMKEARTRDKDIYVFSFLKDEDSYLKNEACRYYSLSIGQLKRLIQLFKKNNIKQIILLGKFDKKKMFSDFEPDSEFKKLLNSLEQLSDNTILTALGDYFENQGIKILKQSTFIDHMLPGPGLLTSHTPSDKLLVEMEYGFEMAREIGKLDIGQTVIVKNKVVLAVEAVEGTNATIARGGKLGKKGIVMAKVSKPQQDLRFDIPTVGRQTLNKLKQVEAKALVFEAHKTFIIKKERFIKEAEKADITVMGMKK